MDRIVVEKQAGLLKFGKFSINKYWRKLSRLEKFFMQ